MQDIENRMLIDSEWEEIDEQEREERIEYECELGDARYNDSLI